MANSHKTNARMFDLCAPTWRISLLAAWLSG